MNGAAAGEASGSAGPEAFKTKNMTRRGVYPLAKPYIFVIAKMNEDEQRQRCDGTP